MSPMLSDYAGSRDNNFNLIRFIAAMLVLYSHSFSLATGMADAEPMRTTLGITWGSIAVDVFFVTSGFLITGSYLSRNNFWRFTWARVLRILPGLLIAVFFCVFVVGLAFTTLPVSEYLAHTQTWKYLIKNSVLLLGIEYRLPGVFETLPWEYAVNGSLWTLPYEVKMYIILAAILLSLERMVRKVPGLLRWSLGAIACVAVLCNIANHYFEVVNENATHLFSMFFVGAAFFVWRDKIPMSSGFCALALLSLLVVMPHKEPFFITYLVLLPYLVLFAAFVPAGGIRRFNRLGDYSYGIYIYAFPVQQAVAAMVAGVSVAGMVALSAPLTLLLAFISWHLVEKRFMKLKSLSASASLSDVKVRPVL